MKALSILGSTGSIGRQTLNVVESLPEQFRIAALAAGNNLEELIGQIERHHPEVVSVADATRADQLAQRLREKNLPLPSIHHGREGMLAAATHPSAELVLSAAVGVVGLEATYKAVKLGRTVALSNKEVLVAAGELVMAAAAKWGRELLPVDSEHNAVHQCLRASRRAQQEGAPSSSLYPEVRRIVLTASGGPFRKTPLAQLAQVSVEQALAHPNWKMGNRITIDSATMMNKGFEIIEARWLFGMRPEQIEVIIHPQSTIHSFVEFNDGAVLAQMAPPDMRMPIQYALTYPARMESHQVAMDWSKLKRLDFEKASTRRFPCLRLAREAMKKGGAMPCALNAADEVAVAAFLEHGLAFPGIAEVVEAVLEQTPRTTFHSIEDVLQADVEARRQAREAVAHLNSKSVAV
ncbi:MAG TPA: 1-deoxy-D-xylulose-5-phosphate reductoisomerase [Candidatus Eremiobacteraceae bacterium]|nr:1-deoxy-D-xylulose-5-phosphate reductoisomerase [Candidatus Eremiobacteraceae bacterium]